MKTDEKNDAGDDGVEEGAALIASGIAPGKGPGKKPDIPPGSAADTASLLSPAESAGAAAPSDLDAAIARALAPVTASLKAIQDAAAKGTPGDKETAARRAAEDVTHRFLGEIAGTGFPIEMLRRFIAPSAEEKKLRSQLATLDGWISEVIASDVKKGKLRYVNIGGASMDGGTTKNTRVAGTPQELIEAGLAIRRR